MINSSIKILIVEDQQISALSLEKVLNDMGYSVSDIVNTGEDAVTSALKNKPDLILMDINLKGKIDGIEAAIQIHKDENIPVIFITAYYENNLIERAKDAVPYGYIIKPYEERELRTILPLAINRYNLELRLEESLERVKMILNGAVGAIAKIVEVRDPYTSGHQKRVGNLAMAISKKMGLDDDIVEMIHLAGTIHDIGKISIPAEILSKPTTLTDSEFLLIKSHPQIGYDILKEIELPKVVSTIVFQHHERINGSGYPLGIKGNKIEIEARIVAVADVVEAISSHRPYRASLGKKVALDEIITNKGQLYDKDAVNACVDLFNNKEFDFDD